MATTFRFNVFGPDGALVAVFNHADGSDAFIARNGLFGYSVQRWVSEELWSTSDCIRSLTRGPSQHLRQLKR